jgi:hypothetical protein
MGMFGVLGDHPHMPARDAPGCTLRIELVNLREDSNQTAIPAQALLAKGIEHSRLAICESLATKIWLSEPKARGSEIGTQNA